MPAARRSIRDRPAKVPLSEALIVESAVSILRSEGLDAVTMRRVAAALDTGPASLYVYVDGSDALREAMLERVVGCIPLEEPDGTRWREQITRLMKATLHELQAHPGIAQVVMIDRGLRRSFDLAAEDEQGGPLPAGRNSLRLIETLLGTLRAGGIEAVDAAWACDVLSLITAAAAIESSHPALGRAPELGSEPRPVERAKDPVADLPRDSFPLVTQLAAELTSGSGDERFSFAVETFLDGLVARRDRNR